MQMTHNYISSFETKEENNSINIEKSLVSAANTAWNRGVSLDDQLFFTANISAARTARNLGSTLDDQLSSTPKTSVTTHLCTMMLNKIRRMQQFLTQEAMFLQY